jgi:hypothetical protein
VSTTCSSEPPPERAQLSFEVVLAFEQHTSRRLARAKVCDVLNQPAVWVESESEWNIFDEIREITETELVLNGGRRMMPDLWDAPSGNKSRDWNGTLDAYRHVAPVEQNQKKSRKTDFRDWAYHSRKGQ